MPSSSRARLAPDRFGNVQRLVVPGHQRHGVGQRAAHRARNGDVLLQRRVAETQLHRLEVALEKLQRLVGGLLRAHEAEAVAVVGRDRLRAAAKQGRERLARRDGERIPHRAVDGGEGHAQRRR